MMTGLLAVVVHSPWVFVVLVVLLVVDCILPVVPAETTVVILATLGAAGAGPSVLSVLLVSIAATMLGDGLAFLIGRRIGLARWGWMRRPAIARAFGWAANRVARRPLSSLVIAKFIPFFRVAVTMSAGASPLRVRRYLAGSLVAAVIYTSYHVAIATFAGRTFAANPLVALAVSLGLTFVLGLLVELVRRVRRPVPA